MRKKHLLTIILTTLLSLTPLFGEESLQKLSLGKDYKMEGKIVFEKQKLSNKNQEIGVYFFYPNKKVQYIPTDLRDEGFLAPNKKDWVKTKIPINEYGTDFANFEKVIKNCLGKPTWVYFCLTVNRGDLFSAGHELSIAIERIDLPQEKTAYECEIRSSDTKHVFNKIDIQKPFKSPYEIKPQ